MLGIFFKTISRHSVTKNCPLHLKLINHDVKALQQTKSIGTLRTFERCSNLYYAKSSLKIYPSVYCSVRGFKLSPQRYANPVVWLVVRPLIKFLAVLTGRGFRKWWKDLPPNKRQHFLGEIKRRKGKLILGMSALSLLAFYYYYSHLELTPITKRKRFMAFDSKQFKVIGDTEFKRTYEQFQHNILPHNHPYTQRVHAVIQRLLRANADLAEMKDKTFSIAVITGDIENAFVLPNGEIFVFEGMLKLCSNNDQLGAVLAHELSHCLLAHGAENFSCIHLLDFLMVFLITVIWAVLPSDVGAIVIHYLVRKLIDVLLQFPYNRLIETEADEVGLNLAARACFDVRESSAFWSKMSILKAQGKEADPEIEFLSTHPSHETRSSHLDGIMEKALQLRSACGCPNLRKRDPRLDIEQLAKYLEAERLKYRPHKPVLVAVPSR